MAFDLESYLKVFPGTQLTSVNANTNLDNGFVKTAGIKTETLNNVSATVNSNYGLGSWGLFDAKTYQSVTTSTISGCCPLILACASPYTNDKVSPFIGGYKETIKSKAINPKHVQKFYVVEPCAPQAQIVHVGNTNYTLQLSPKIAACSFNFYCGQTYSLRLDIVGSPILRALNHQGTKVIQSLNRCCANPVPDLIDSTLVMIDWANAIITDPIFKELLSPIVYTEAGTALYAPGTSGQSTWDNYVSPGHVTGKTAGIRLTSAYVDTKFQNCTFQYTDFVEVEPLKIYASMVDFNGDPCAFTGICVKEECPPIQAKGLGETDLRELGLSESMRQFYFNSNLREREITQGIDLFTAIDRNTRYYRYTLLHALPAGFNQQTGGYSADRYRLVVFTRTRNTTFEALMAAWLTSCGPGCTSLEVTSCPTCVPVAI